MSVDALQRFVEAQDRLDAGSSVYARAVAELRRGRKQTHWMWFVFPQIAGLGSSDMSRYFAIQSLAEAAAYLAHPILGSRLLECTSIVNAIEGRAAWQIFGQVDSAKFRSCMTLFEAAAPQEPLFSAALARYFSGERDAATLRILGGGRG